MYSDQRMAEKPDSGEVRVEMERVKKWVKMLRNWDSSATRDKLRKRVYKGVPDSLRGQAWSKMLNLSTVREEQTGKYQVKSHILNSHCKYCVKNDVLGKKITRIRIYLFISVIIYWHTLSKLVII